MIELEMRRKKSTVEPRKIAQVVRTRRHVLRNDRNPASQALCTGRGVDRNCRPVVSYATGSAGAAWGRERPRKRPVATFPVAGYRFPSRFFLHAVKSERMRRPVRTGALRAPVRTGRYVLPSTYHPRASGELSSTPQASADVVGPARAARATCVDEHE